MAPEEYKINDVPQNVVSESTQDALWEAADQKHRLHALNLSYTDRFKLMMRLMRINMMLKNATVTHKKIPE